MAESDFTSTRMTYGPSENTKSVSKDGIYIVSASVGCYSCRPAPHARVTLRRRGYSLVLFSVFAEDISSNVVAAIALKQNDELTLVAYGIFVEPQFFSVAYVSDLNGHYTTVVTTSVSNSYLLHFDMQLAANSWNSVSGNQSSSFSVPTTGMYWVAATVVPISKDVTIRVTTENSTSARILFNVYGEKYRSGSCSGAFYLSAGSVVKAKNLLKTTYTEDTILSFVYLQGNRKPDTGRDEHIAFTGIVTSELNHKEDHKVISFPGHLTNYGRLYTNDGYIIIRRSGSYIISQRTNPPTDAITRVKLVINGKPKYTFTSQIGVPSAETVVLDMKANDTFKFISEKTRIFQPGTLLSVAFLQP